MSDQCVGEIRMFGGNFAPEDWVLCNGQLLQITQYEVLYSLIGTTYGGDGIKTFAVPDLRSRIPLSQGTSASHTPYLLGQAAGTETVTLTQAQMPLHSHTLMASSAPATANNPTASSCLAASANSSGGTNADAHYLVAGSPVAAQFQLNAASVQTVGGNVPHPNIMPSFCVNFIIATVGIYPQFPA